MRTFRHWTPRYVVARLNEILYHKQHPDHPWLTQEAVSILEHWLKPSDTGAEFGSGRSTIWFAKHVCLLKSVENDPEWYDRISIQLKRTNLKNVDYILAVEHESKETNAAQSKYVQAATAILDNSLDFALVDGIWRSICANALVNKLHPGGLLIIDNANWFLPCKSFSPNSRTLMQGPASEDWTKFQSIVNNWRSIWTSSGVTDTAFYVKPCG
jgi:predicted O-methyltransferase YrrM